MNTNKIGEFIKEQRKQNNLTQKQLAELLNCTDKAISRWETGTGLPEVSFLLPLANALNVSVNEILSGEKIEKEHFVEKSDDLIIETIASNDKKINKLHIVIYLLILCIAALFALVLPIIAQPGDEMGVIFAMIGSVPITSLLLGLTKVKNSYKFTYPFANVVLFFFSWLFLPFWSKDFEALLLYSIVIAILSLVSIITGIIINKIVSAIIKFIKNK